jgi:branched-chain amino acid aminotransferase
MPGGTGNVKCAANYGPSFLAQRIAQDAGCQQVVWLDSAQRHWVEEMGGMNLFFVRGDEVLTPALTGTLLPGVTRDSLLALAERAGYRVAETRISVDDWRAGCASGEITEVFACGTAAVVTPVGRVVDAGGDWTVGDGAMGPVTRRLRTALVDLQHGRTADPDGWMHAIR